MKPMTEATRRRRTAQANATGFTSELLALVPIEDSLAGSASVRVTRESHDGRRMLHVRIVEPDEQGDLMPTSRGVNLPPDVWRSLMPALLEALQADLTAEARRLQAMGLGQREIAMALGINLSAAHRALHADEPK